MSPIPNTRESGLAGKGLRIALLTASRDKPYALGLGPALADQGLELDFIAGDAVDGPEVRTHPRIRYLNLRNQQERASLWTKMTRVMVYYARLLAYAAGSRASIFHLLWNNKFEYFDRTILMLYYRMLGKRIVFTAHNVNAGARDGNDSWLNRRTLRFQYRLCDHIFVHTKRMKEELRTEFGIPGDHVTVIPFGINNTLPTTALTPEEARKSLQLERDDQVLLFFGNIAPYKGVDVLVRALAMIAPAHPRLRLVIAGRPKGSEEYWAGVRRMIESNGLGPAIREHIVYIPDEQVEVFMKASDALVLPYTHVFQSGVLFLGYSFGLPVLATDVGSLREEIIEGRTGLVCRPNDPADLARMIEAWLDSDLYADRRNRSADITAYANHQYSWTTVGGMTRGVYEGLSLAQPGPKEG
jgi:glycosyltransferase involved in cell wall biosynthesis